MKGQCKRCGDCCLYGNAIEYDVYQVELLKVFVFKRVVKKKVSEIEPCVNLVYNIETRLAECASYRNRPSVCKQFPSTEGELIFKNCGFRKE